jgi:hypothetical protein
MCQPWKFTIIMLSLLCGSWIGPLCVEAIGSDSEKPNPLITKTTPSGLEVSVLEVTNLDEFLHGTCPPGRVEVPKLDRLLRKGILVHFTIKTLPSYKGTPIEDWGTATDSSGEELWRFATAPEPQLLKALKPGSDVLHCKFPFYGGIIGYGQTGEYPILGKFRFDNVVFDLSNK